MSESPNDDESIILADVSKGQPSDLKFPLEFVREKIFLCGVTGSGKSFTAGLLMEEINRVGLQFVCFDVLGAHGGLKELSNVEGLEPKNGETVNLKGLVRRLGDEPTSFVIDLSDLNLIKQQTLITEYCEEMLTQKLNKGIMSIFEECQDFVPQRGIPISAGGIVRMSKLGRQYGYGVCLISQRPASVSKDALSQCSVYLIHNLINHRDLKAVEDQMGFGTDKEQLKKVLTDVSAASQGEVICYSPSYFRNENFYRASKIRGDRKVNHTGKNIEMKPATSKTNNFKASQESMLDKTYDFEGINDYEVIPPAPKRQSLSSASLFDEFPSYSKPSESYVIDLDSYGEQDTALNAEGGFKSPIMGVGMIAALTSGIFIIYRGLKG